MLTCEEIEAKARAFPGPINRDTYNAIAEQIHPRVKEPRISYAPDDRLDRFDTPEWKEYRRAQEWRTDDWADMVVMCVALWQWRTWQAAQ